MDLWIGKDGYPVRVDSVQGIKNGTTKVSAKFSGYGTTAPVTAPPADQEADQTLKDAGLGGLGGH